MGQFEDDFIHFRNQIRLLARIQGDFFCDLLDQDDDVVQGLQAGADAYMTKPFRPRCLEAAVRKLLEG